MKTSKKTPARCRKNPPGWQAGFEPMIPAVVAHAKIAFRHLRPEAREEATQETLCNACSAYARLAELGKTDVAFASALARFGVAQTKVGRKVGGKLNCQDVLSDYCQRKKKLVVERLDRFDFEDQTWSEILIEDRRVGPAETAIVRIDFADWLHWLPRRLRRIATFLATGETTTAAAKRFRLSQGRISQVRRELFLLWHHFQNNTVIPSAV
jgi:hypothetical protein